MKTFRVGIQVIKVYEVDIEAKDDDEAIYKAYELSSTKIEEDGDLTNIEVDHPAIIEEIEE